MGSSYLAWEWVFLFFFPLFPWGLKKPLTGFGKYIWRSQQGVPCVFSTQSFAGNLFSLTVEPQQATSAWRRHVASRKARTPGPHPSLLWGVVVGYLVVRILSSCRYSTFYRTGSVQCLSRWWSVPTERERDGPVGPLHTSPLFAGYVEKLNF
jgi:hypothetical protein